MERFVLRSDAYGRQTLTGEYLCVKEPLTEAVLTEHVNGGLCVGAYAVLHTLTRWICIDVDGDPERPEPAETAALALARTCTHFSLTPYVEWSGKKGWHIWIFLADVDAGLARRVGLGIVAETPEDALLDLTESAVFPKQSRVEPGQFGNLVKLPWGKRRDNSVRGRFVDAQTLQRLTSEEQLRLLESARIHTSEELEELTAQNGWDVEKEPVSRVTQEAVTSLLRSSSPNSPLPCYDRLVDPDSGSVIPEGHRDNVLFSIAKQHVRRGTPEKHALRDLLLINRERCRPEVPAATVQAKVASAYKSQRRSAGCAALQSANLCPAVTGTPCPLFGAKPELEQVADAAFQAEEGWEFGIEPLSCLMTDPPIFTATVRGQSLSLSPTELFNWTMFKEKCGTTLFFVPILPVMRSKEGKLLGHQVVWEALLNEAMKSIVKIPVPAAATPTGQMWLAVRSFLRDGDVTEQKPLINSLAVVLWGDHYYFRPETWVHHRDLRRLNTIPANDFWRLIRSKGGESCAFRYGTGPAEVTRAWRIPISSVEETPGSEGEPVVSAPDTSDPPRGLQM